MTGAPLRIAIVGTGRMATVLSSLATERGVEVVARMDRTAMSAAPDEIAGALKGADVALEFTTPSSAVANIHACVAAGCPVVVGTTGWYDELPEVERYVAGAGASLLWAPNFSAGVVVMTRLAREAGRLARALDDFSAHLVETHHGAKRDAPSGTAIVLERAMADALGRGVPVTSIRTGSVPGTHELSLDGPFEHLTIRHEARDRRVFADGALIAAAWLRGRTGVFTMDDVLDTEGR